MPQYNTQFDLTRRDIELIETAVQAQKKELSLQRLSLLADDNSDEKRDDLANLTDTLADFHDLLGRLHNQKVFFRPERVRDAPYVGG